MSDDPGAVSRRRSWAWTSFIVAAFVVVADQISKSLAAAHLSSVPRHVIGPFGFQLTYNTGSSFSLFQGSTGPLVVFDLVFVAILAYVGGRAESVWVRVGVGLMLGGALGNLTDRVVRHHDGGVLDFITLTHWPTFNLADSAITIGAVVIVISVVADLLRQRAPRSER